MFFVIYRYSFDCCETQYIQTLKAVHHISKHFCQGELNWCLARTSNPWTVNAVAVRFGLSGGALILGPEVDYVLCELHEEFLIYKKKRIKE